VDLFQPSTIKSSPIEKRKANIKSKAQMSIKNLHVKENADQEEWKISI
jgi:hypothetical protein